MKITRNFIDTRMFFIDVKPGQIFITEDDMIFMKIEEIIPEEGDVVNAVYLTDGDIACFREDQKVKVIDNAELTLNMEA